VRRLLVTDLDGTLLRPDGSLGPRTRDAVNEFISSGGLFSYATARSFHSARRLTAGLDLALPVITYGGAITVDPMSGLADSVMVMSVTEFTAILGVLAEHRLQPIVFAMVASSDRVCWVDREPSAGVTDFLSRRPGDPRFLPLSSWSDLDPAGVFYLSVIASAEELAAAHRELQRLESVHTTFSEDVYVPGQFWLEIGSVRATKACGVRALQHKVGADVLICFGDNHNDLPMFDISDEAYAVANAVDEVKARATSVIGSNADEAVASWLEARRGSV
jgi:Cof subfamily protein (haloacid dehalogenase superfamily)